MPLQQSLNIAVVGAGLAGRLSAWRLLQCGHSVTMFEAGKLNTPSSAAYTAAAMISPMSEVVISEKAIYDLGVHSLKLWQQWLEGLDQSPSTLIQTRGSLVVAHPRDESELLQFYKDLEFHLGHSLVNNPQHVEWIEGYKLNKLEPGLAAHFSKGLFLANEAHLDHRTFLQKVLEEIKALGGTLRESTPISLNATQGKIDHLLEDFDYIADCRGIGAAENLSELRGVRGEVIWVQTDEIQLTRPIRLMHPRYKLYVVPKPNNQFIIGATEIESQDRSPMSVQSALELCSALYTLNPAFAEARIIEMDANLRPSFLDNMPRVDINTLQSKRDKKQHIVSINGLYRHGYLIAPSVVEHAVNIINGEPTHSTFATCLR